MELAVALVALCIAVGWVWLAMESSPWDVLLGLGVFLLLQELLIAHLPGEALQRGIKNSDEFLIWFFFAHSVFRARDRRWLLVDVLALGLLGAGIVSSVLNHVRPVVAGSDFILMFKFYAMFRGVSLLMPSNSAFRRLATLVFVSALLIWCIVVVEVLFPMTVKTLIWGGATNAVFVEERGGIVGASGIFNHPGTLGWFMAVGSAFAAAFLLETRKPRYLIMLIMFLLAVFLSTRRKPLIGLFLAILVFLFIVFKGNRSTRRKILLGVLTLFVTFTALFSNLVEHEATDAIAAYFEPENPDSQARLVLYLYAGVISLDNFPFGVGLGRYAGYISIKYYSDVYYKYGLNHVWGLSGETPEASFATDTYWPYVLGETGIAGFVFFSALLVLLFRRLVRSYHHSASSSTATIAVAAIIIFIEAFFEAFASPVYAASLSIYFIFVPAGMCFVMQEQSGAGDRRSASLPEQSGGNEKPL